ncbi:MAG TPA: hypothetical protein PLO52_00320 [Flavobacterium alvei]|nr:hypothetical protein [Flavobacterium alvei]
MSIPLSSNFLLAAGLPLDDRTVVADITERDAIDNVKRYEGLTVYLESDASTYQLQGGITNSDWVLLASSFVDPNTNNVVAVKVATTTILPNSPLYDNGSGGVGATLQPATEGAIGNIDGIPILLLDRILVKNQSNPIENGIYFVDEVGDVSTQYRLVRADDSDETSELNEQIVSPSKGTANKGRLFSQQTVNPTVGSNNIVYAQVSGVFVTQAGTGTQILGQVPWWNTAIRQLSRGTSSFVWDITNSRLGIGTSTPVEKLHVAGGTARIENGGGSLAGFAIRNNSASFDNAVTVGGLGNMNVYGNFNIDTNAQSDVTKPTWNMRIRTDLDRIEFMRVPAGGSVLTEVGQLALSSPGLLGVGLGTGIVATAYVHAAPSTTANASVRIPAGVAPTSPLQGDIWQTSNHLFWRSNDGNTYQLDNSSSGFVTQQSSGTQVINQIPVYTATGAEITKGTSNLIFDPSTNQLRVGGVGAQTGYNVIANTGLMGDYARIQTNCSIGTFADPVSGTTVTISGGGVGKAINSAFVATTGTVSAHSFGVTSNQSSLPGSNLVTAVSITLGNNSDGASEVSDLWRGVLCNISSKSNSASPLTNAINYEAVFGNTNSRTMTVTNLYGFKSSGINSAPAGGAITASGNAYGFYADQVDSTFFTGASYWGFYQKQNTTKNIFNEFESNTGIGLPALTKATAKLHLGAGTATANTAPLKFTSGTNLTTPEDGAFEYNGSHLFITIGSTRFQLDQQISVGTATSGQVTFWTGSTTIGGDGAYLWDNTNKRLGIGTTPAAFLHVQGTTEQARFGYDSTHFASITVNSAGKLTIAQGIEEFTMQAGVGGTFNQGFTFLSDLKVNGTLTVGSATSSLWPNSGNSANSGFQIGGSSAMYKWFAIGTNSLSVSGGASAASFVIANSTWTVTTSGVCPIVATAAFIAPTLVETSGTIVDSSNVYINAAPTGGTSNKYAFWVDSGTSRFDGDVKLNDAGNGLYIKEGTNATMGVATLVAGTVTVNTTKVTANSRIFLTVNGGTLTNVGAQYVSARTAGTSFTITSLNVLDTSQTAWMIVEPA